ncbi:MAG: ATP-binding protein [Actinobacteria bacterium]|nr:ATP-binding protein [Actinomycetota bacterium]
MNDATIRLTFPAKADYLLLARLALGGVVREMPVGPELLADLRLAVTEACGNAVRHAYGDGGGSVEVAFLVSDDRLEMVVEDTGSGLELPLIEQLLEPEPPAATVEPADGGMGIAIIRAIVDELDVRSGADGRGTVVHMTKYLSDAV